MLMWHALGQMCVIVSEIQDRVGNKKTRSGSGADGEIAAVPLHSHASSLCFTLFRKHELSFGNIFGQKQNILWL